MKDNMKEFVAYNRKPLMVLKKLRKVLGDGVIKNSKAMLDELVGDTERDSEA